MAGTASRRDLRLIERSALLEFEIKSLEAVRAKLERDVALLSPQKPDADLVEEIAREMLGFVRPGRSSAAAALMRLVRITSSAHRAILAIADLLL